MVSMNDYTGLEPRVVALVHHHASRLAASDPRLEQEDMEQELHLHLHVRANGHCPRRGSRATYDDRVVRHRIADLARDARASKRGSPAATVSLDHLLSSQVGREAGSQPGGIATSSMIPEGETHWEDDAALRCDLARFLATRPSHLRQFLLLLLRHSVTETARIIGRHRSSVYVWLAAFRAQGRAAGLNIYIGPSPTDSSSFE
jgi:hypothetical protein